MLFFWTLNAFKLCVLLVVKNLWHFSVKQMLYNKTHLEGGVACFCNHLFAIWITT